MAEPPPRSPLAAWAPRLADLSVHSGGALALRELPFLTQLNLRSRTGGSGLPEINATAGSPVAQLLGLGPDECLAVAESGTAAQLEARLRQRLAGVVDSIVDVSAARTTLLLSGPAVRDVLAHGCALDLDPAVFAVGRCAQTMLAHAQVILWRTGPDEYRIMVRRSFAGYLATWLLDAATEFEAGGEAL